jgi:cobalt-zinc-cadmium resistance protein CzcA
MKIAVQVFEQNGQQLTVRVPGTLNSIQDIENVMLSQKNGLPIRVADVATVSIGHDLRTGGATYNGEETVLGIAMMMMGENSKTVAQALDHKMQEVKRSLPEGVVVETVYNRSSLVDKAIKTVAKNLIEGAILVIVILFIFLGNFRAALITACIIPLSMLFTITGMAEQNISANLMSLGAGFWHYCRWCSGDCGELHSTLGGSSTPKVVYSLAKNVLRSFSGG